MKLRGFGLAVLLGLGCVATAHGEIYRWVDAEGQVHYSQSLPPTGAAVEKVQGASKPAVAPDTAQKALQEQVEKVDTQKQKTVEAKDLEGKVKEEIEKRKKNCEVARTNLQTLENLGGRKIQDSEGKVIRLSEEDRQKRLTEAQQQIKDWCEGIPEAKTP